MPARLYLRPSPRAFFLISDTHALVFRQPAAGETKASRNVVVAEFLPLDEVDTTGLISVGRGTVEGVLGVTSVPSGDRSPIPETFLILLAASSPLSPLLPGSSLRPARVLAVEFYSLSSNFWDSPDMLGTLEDDDPIGDSYTRTGSNTPTMSQAAQAGVSNPTDGMKKYLCAGSFFHADGVSWDISSSLGSGAWGSGGDGAGGKGVGATEQGALEDFDERFVWNARLLKPFLNFRAGLPPNLRAELDEHALLVPVIQGFVDSRPFPIGSSRDDVGTLALISRLSCKRAGARFRTRGIDDDGNVANFVETETLMTVKGITVSYVQVRGSVPVFWQQPTAGLQTLQQKVEITRPFEATQRPFDQHFDGLIKTYGAVHAVNLLGQKEAEQMLSEAYEAHVAKLKSELASAEDEQVPDSAVQYTNYDFHTAVKNGGHDSIRADFNRMLGIQDSLDRFEYTAIDLASGSLIEQQHGVFRVNCLDCLDRTNFVQEVISYLALFRALANHNSPLCHTSSPLWSVHRDLWADNGDLLSKTYAGTGAINTSATRSGRKTFAGLISDATKSVGRAYINNFQDKGKQQAIDMLLGLLAGQRQVVLFDPIGDSVHTALKARRDEYATPRPVTIFSGTWNVNGKAPVGVLDPWLFPNAADRADIYAISFQEIVELTAQQIVQTDPAKKRVWETVIMQTFTNVCGEGEYILMRSEQLVGTALMIVVKSSLLPFIRNVEYAYKKTGLGGMSGNKGGVGIRFDLYDSSMCFMTCHLAAGQANYDDRNTDYRTIVGGLHFLRGKTIDGHDIVVWSADFNYRIDLSNEVARPLALADEFAELYEHDQLSLARSEGEVFVGYQEGQINFRPTYKYDNGTDTYDSSEKQRVPSWTDRVLFKGTNLHCIAYDSAELRISDHRPVFAVIEGSVDQVDHAKKAHIREELARIAQKKFANGKLDDLVESAAQGGVRGLVKELTSVSVTPSPVPSPQPERKAPPVISRDSKPARSASVRAAPARGFAPSPTGITPVTSTLSATVSSAYARLGYPTAASSGLPQRTASLSAPGVPGVGYAARQRPPPPPRPSSGGGGSPSGSQVLTPTSTGDFVIVPSPRRSAPAPPPKRSNSTASATTTSSSNASAPPRLPPRPGSARTGTLDMDSPPPTGLALPVQPDNAAKTAPLPVLYGGAKAPPPLPSSRKPVPTLSQLEEAAATKPPPPVPSKTGPSSPIDVGKKVPPAVAPKPGPSSPVDIGKKAPPVVAPKPVLSPAATVASPKSPEGKKGPAVVPKPAGLQSKPAAPVTAPKPPALRSNSSSNGTA
ncbi:Inositol-1,4,5-trisphosphate 5-phosphatase 1 [Vanrija albida]|uniref:phosphoinositide 5-phosphatase n=1 Tax=Vanrija albida TaxID=181172 RepID=A0ABR3QB75_9TREE